MFPFSAFPKSQKVKAKAICVKIRAEANVSAAGNGNTAEALESYNAIRERAFGDDFIEETGVNQLLEKIQLERRWELCFENDRYHNLRRLKQPVRDGVAHND